jgi:TolB-like protein
VFTAGPIDEVRDVNDRPNVAGAGINLARRVMDWGDAGHILLSKRVAEDLAHSRQWGRYLHDLGECAGKHGVPIFLVNFYGDGVGNPQLPKAIRQARLEQAAKAAATGGRRRFRRVYLAIAATVVSIGVIGLCLWFYWRQNQASFLPEEKSIAVLPFENFSPAKDNAFFADGIQDDILTSLAKIKDLRVISRSSVMAFRDAASQNLRDIGRRLAVANILEGSVRKEGDRVVVNVQLIDTKITARFGQIVTTALWSIRSACRENWPAKLPTRFGPRLSEDEKAQAAAKPTQNADAYVFYLRANQISRNPDTLLEDYKTAEQLYMQANRTRSEFRTRSRAARICLC